MAMHDILVRVGADTSDYTRGLNNAATKAQSFAMLATSAVNSVALAVNDGGNQIDTRLSRTQGKMAGFGMAVGGISAGIATSFLAAAAVTSAGIAGLVNEARKFQDAFTGVRKTTDATEEQFAKLSRGLRDMTLEIPATADEIAGVAEVAGQLGVKVNDIETFTETMVKMGTATNMSSEEAATSLAQFMNIMGTSFDDVENLGSTIVHLGNNLATTESKIVDLGLRLAGAGAQAGMTESDVLALAGTLSSLGLRTESAGSAFSRVILEMNSAVMDGGEQLDKFAKASGMSANEFKKAFEKDAAKAIQSFIENLGEMGDKGEDLTAILDDLGLSELRVRDAILRTAEASDSLGKSLDLGNKAWEENVALSDEATERYSTFTSQMAILGNKVRYVAIVFGTALMDALGGTLAAVGKVLDVFVKLAQKFEESEGSISGWVAALVLSIPVVLALGAAFFGLISVLGFGYTGMVMLAGAVGVATTSFVGMAVGLAIFLAKIVLIPAAVVAAATAIIIYWDEIVAATKSMVNAVADAFDRFVNIVTDSSLSIAEKLDILTEPFREVFSEIADIVTEKATIIGEKLYDMIPEPVLDVIKAGADLIVDIFEDLMDTLDDIFSGDFEKLGESFAHIAPTIIGYLLGGIPGVVIAAARYLPAIADSFADDSGDIVGAAESIVADFLEGLVEGIELISDVGVDYITAFLEGMVEALPEIIEVVTTVLMSFVEAIVEFLPIVLEAGITIVMALLEGIIESIPILLESLAEIIQVLVVVIAELLPLFLEVGIEIILTIIEGIVEILPQLIDTFIEILDVIVETIIELLPVIIDAGIEIVFALVEGILDMLPELITAAGELIEGLFNAMVDFFPKFIVAGVQLTKSLAQGLIKALPQILLAAGMLIAKLLAGILKAIPQLLAAGAKLLMSLIEGLLSVLGNLLSTGYDLIWQLLQTIAEFVPQMLSAGVDLVMSLIDGLLDLLGSVLDAGISIGESAISGAGKAIKGMTSVGKDMISGLVGGIKSMASKAVDAAKGVVKGAVDGAKALLGIKSPSRVMKKEIGFMMIEGLLQGLDSGVNDVARMAQIISEAAKPEDIQMADISIGNIRGQAETVSRQIQAEVSQGEYNHDRKSNETLAEIRDELRRQKQMIVEMDGRQVGRAVEPYVSEAREESKIRKSRRRG